MSNEWEEYKQREAYFNQLADQQREEEEYQMRVQEYIAQLESEKAALERRLKETENYAKTFHSNYVESKCKLNIAVEALKEMPCMCPEALGYSKGDKCLVCTTIATIEGKPDGISKKE